MNDGVLKSTPFLCLPATKQIRIFATRITYWCDKRSFTIVAPALLNASSELAHGLLIDIS